MPSFCRLSVLACLISTWEAESHQLEQYVKTVRAQNIPVNPGVMAASFRDKGVRSSRVLIG